MYGEDIECVVDSTDREHQRTCSDPSSFKLQNRDPRRLRVEARHRDQSQCLGNRRIIFVDELSRALTTACLVEHPLPLATLPLMASARLQSPSIARTGTSTSSRPVWGVETGSWAPSFRLEAIYLGWVVDHPGADFSQLFMGILAANMYRHKGFLAYPKQTGRI